MSLKNKNKDKNAKKSTYVRSSVSINAVPKKKGPRSTRACTNYVYIYFYFPFSVKKRQLLHISVSTESVSDIKYESHKKSYFL